MKSIPLPLIVCVGIVVFAGVIAVGSYMKAQEGMVSAEAASAASITPAAGAVYSKPDTSAQDLTRAENEESSWGGYNQLVDALDSTSDTER